MLNNLPRSTVLEGASQGAQMVRYLPSMWETWVQSLDWDDPLEKIMETHSSILAWRIPIDRGAWGATVHGIATELNTSERLSTKCVGPPN